MVSTPVIGLVEQSDLVLRRNADTAFSVEWFGDLDGLDPVAIGSATGQVRDSDLETASLVLDMNPYITIVGNAVHVVVPMSAVQPLAAMRGGRWDLVVTAATGERRAVLEGNASIVRGATR